MSFRVLALALVVVLLVTFATPAKAEAIEPLTILAIVGAALIVVVLIVYLVVANVEGDKMRSQAPELPVYALPGPVAAEEPALVLVTVDTPRSEGP
jgi:hypothetical protein